MTNPSNQFEEQLQKLRNQYAAQLPEKIQAIINDWNSISRIAGSSNADTTNPSVTSNTSDKEESIVTRLHRNIHSLIGTSGTFGFTALSQHARQVETTLKPFTQDTANQANLATISNKIEGDLQKLLDLVADITGTRQHLVDRPELEFADENIPNVSNNPLNNTLIYYMDDNIASSSVLIENLKAYGFVAQHFHEPVSLLEKINQQKPALVILDLIVPDFSESWIFNLCNQLSSQQIKTFILSVKQDFECRLAAVRAGANAYIVKPADVPALVNIIRTELNINPVKPPHILLVDDQESILEYYSTVLQAAGMKVDISDNPLEVLDRLERQRPDLIVLDINMPLVKGDGLAAVIRQIPEYQSIPILFFSGDTHMDQKTQLLEIGSDDLLQKGMPIAELVSQIKSRVERAKILSSFMYEDSLTGLLNHGQIQLAAERSFSLAKRHNRLCSFVMIDLDNFKTINDTWGHQTGDKVIKAFSQLLQQRLRPSDYMGRYGGEEFMLVLAETSLQDAGNLTNELRKTFQQIEFIEGAQKFHVTFSAGVADNQLCNSAAEQIRKTDNALYKAKSNGKNKVCMHLHQPGATPHKK